MKGKIVNLSIGGMNIVFAILLIVYTAYIPQEITELTVQELSVTKNILKVIYLILGLVVIIDIFQYKNMIDNSRMKTGYLFGIFSLSFFIIKEPVIAVLPIISGIIVIFQTLKDNAIEIDSISGISFILLIIIMIFGSIGVSVFYKEIGQYIKNKENENALSYKKDYFKYITELEIDDVYINVKKNGKYGYLNQNGDTVIDFKYDYASPFINITMYNKEFQIALVCEDGFSKIIMKNERQVMSYKSEISNENYNAKMQELTDLYKDTFGQGGNMQIEIEKKTDNMKRALKYDESSTEYTYRYDYNDEYDIIVTQSNLGLGDKYELAKKDNLNIKIALNCPNIDYDEDSVYLYSNSTIPYFDVLNKEQGWFTTYGKKNTMSGKAQILDFIDDKILIRNYNNNTIYFIDSDGNMISDSYKKIYISDDKYIVKNNNDKYMIIDKEFNKIFEEEFDVIDPYLAKYNLYIVCNIDNIIDFNDYGFAKMNYRLVNSQGQTILDGIEQIYGNYYQISNDKSIAYVTRYEEFLNNLKDLEFNFVGDKYYK